MYRRLIIAAVTWAILASFPAVSNAQDAPAAAALQSWDFTKGDVHAGSWYFPGGNPKAGKKGTVYYTLKQASPGPRLNGFEFKAIDVSRITLRLTGESRNAENAYEPAKFKSLRVYWARTDEITKFGKWPFSNGRSQKFIQDEKDPERWVADLTTHGNWVGTIGSIFIEVGMDTPSATSKWGVYFKEISLLSDAAAAQVSAPVAPKPRVIVVLLDSLRADHLHYMGYDRETSPWFDKLAQESVVFKKAYATSDGTQRSVPAIMTGRYFSQLFSKPIDSDGLPADATTLADLFQQAGWRTAAWTTNPHLTPDNHFDQGFDSFEALIPQGVVYSRIEHVIRKIRNGYTRSDKPEFLYVHLMDTHTPFFPPAPFCDMFAPPEHGTFFKEGLMNGTDGSTAIGLPDYWRENHDVQPPDIAYMISQYDGEIRYASEYMPLLLDALQFSPETDSLVVLADHGEQFYEHGYINHNKSTLVEELHVPLMFQCPGLAPAACDVPVTLVDIVPTLCELNNLQTPQGLPGRSLVPALRGNALEPRELFAEGSDDRGPTGVVITADRLYYLNTEVNRWRCPWLLWPIEELLFDLANDPRCMNDIAAQHPPEADRLNETLRRLNPRFAQCLPPALTRDHGDVAFGTALPVAAPAAGMNKVTVDTPVVSPAMCEDAEKPYLLSFEYTVEADSLMRVYMSDKATGKHYYAYTFLKPQDQPKPFQAVVYPRTQECVVRFACKKGSGAFQNVQLKRVLTPEITIVSPETAAPPQQRNLTDDEKERMEALGYIQ